MRHLLVLALGLLACSSDGGAGQNANEVAFHAEEDLLPGFSYDSGLQPASGPVQLELIITSKSTFTADAIGVGVEDGSSQSLVGKPASGKLSLDGTFAPHRSSQGRHEWPELRRRHSRFDERVDHVRWNEHVRSISSLHDGRRESARRRQPSVHPAAGRSSRNARSDDRSRNGARLRAPRHVRCALGRPSDVSRRARSLGHDQDHARRHAADSGRRLQTVPASARHIALPSAPAGVDLGTKTVTFGSSDVIGEHASATTCDP